MFEQQEKMNNLTLLTYIEHPKNPRFFFFFFPSEPGACTKSDHKIVYKIHPREFKESKLKSCFSDTIE